MEKDRREGGWALVSVLCVVAMLALLAAGSQELTITSSRAERATNDVAEMDADFDAGLVRALEGIGDTRTGQRWRVDGIAQTFAFDGSVMRIAVQDEAGRIDINAADGSLIRRLFISQGLSEDAAQALADKVLDWRQELDFAHLHGATDEEYATKGYPWHPRHGPFQTIEELRLVMDMTPQLFARIRPAITVYTKRPAIDPQVAPRQALAALFSDDPGKADQIIQKREDAAAHGEPVDTVDPNLAEYGQTYTVTIDLVKYGRRRHREYVAMLTGDDKRPCLLLAYR